MEITSYLLGKKSSGGGGGSTLQDKEVTITENGTTNITADSGYDGLSEVEVTTNVSSSIDDYFNDTTSAGQEYTGNWKNLVKKLPTSINFTGTSISSLFKNYKGTNIPTINLSKQITSADNAFSACNNVSSIDISNINLSAVTNMQSMFSSCSNLENLSLSNTTTNKLTNTSSMFSGCWKLKNIPLFDTSGVTSMNLMFNDCRDLETIPLFNTSSATNMQSMFSGCHKIEEIPTFNTSNVTSMSSTFQNCENLRTVPLLNTSKVTNFSYMFFNDFNLTDASLDNILQMCINATAYTGTKTLDTLRINNTTYYPASRIQALPHYQDFIDAGWTLGY